MGRFFKSAAFPILIVVVLALFARQLVSPGDEQEVPTYSEFLEQVQDDEVESVAVKTESNTIEVTPAESGAEPYETAYPDNTEQALINSARAPPRSRSRWRARAEGASIGTILAVHRCRSCCSSSSGSS